MCWYFLWQKDSQEQAFSSLLILQLHRKLVLSVCRQGHKGQDKWNTIRSYSKRTEYHLFKSQCILLIASQIDEIHGLKISHVNNVLLHFQAMDLLYMLRSCPDRLNTDTFSCEVHVVSDKHLWKVDWKHVNRTLSSCNSAVHLKIDRENCYHVYHYYYRITCLRFHHTIAFTFYATTVHRHFEACMF